MSNPSIDESSVDRLITFTTKHDTDTTIWRGVVSGIVSRRLAAREWDIQSYNEGVRRTDPTVSTNLDTLDYFILTLDNGTSGSQTRSFAYQWIADNSLVFLDAASRVTIEILEPSTNDHDQILTVLRAAGYTKSRIVSVS